MKTSVYAICAFVFLSSTISLSQTNRVLVKIDWPSETYEQKVEVYDPANNLLVSICNGVECYQTSGSSEPFTATYDLGCLALDPVVLPNYTVKLFDANDNGWSGSASVTVNVAGVDVFTNDGSTANLAGVSFPFNVNNTTTYCTYPDTDGDFVIDFVDQDDDNDGILDTEEGLGLDTFTCAVPSLVFNGGVLDSGTAGTVGAIYRFGNALEGYDVLLEIVELTNTTISKIDDDTIDNADFLQSELTFTGTGTPGVTYKFTLVDVGTSTPSSTIYRIGGTTWDCDGTNEYQESVRYYNPSAYGLDNPTSLTADTYVDGTGITAGNVTYGGFSTNTILRSYFQFQSNTFNIRMQLKKTTSSSRTRLYAMSFTQCDIFDYKAPILTVVSGVDTDGDGIDNQLDLDSDNDGIPDNVELQGTTTYIPPNNTYDYTTGIDTAYAAGLTVTDTDGDNIPDFIDSDSDNDGIPDIEENGMANAIVTFTDDDGDGLDNIFETNGTNDASFDVNEDIEVPSTDLPDTDGDLLAGGDVDYRDNLDAYYFDASLDFDGIDDYVDSDLDLDGMTQATIMAWVKLDPAFSNTAYILNQGDFEVGILATRKLWVSMNGKLISVPDSHDFELNKWYHVTVIFDSSLSNDNLKVYVSGEFSVLESHPSLRSPIDVWTPGKFTIGKEMGDDKKYFKGAIDEVRVFNQALTEGQMHQIVHQEIDNNSGIVKGKVVPKNIIDFNTTATIPWSALEVYYPMTDIISSKTSDYSDNNFTATLHNITTMQRQTAPMPYTTKADGDWDQMNTWSNGDVWDLSTKPEANPWSIIKVSHNMFAKNDIHSHALIIDADKKITLTDDKVITNLWYLELNGTIDLEGDSQLIQGIESDLVTSADGKVLRRQEGNTNYFWYNYWSSPVGTQATTAFSDNNAPTNNTNNTPFSLNMLKDGSGTPFQFTNAYNEPGKISREWLYTFQNGITYYDWDQINENTAIQPGFGYTQKGTGTSETEQQYIFEGKPNNGTILVAADDVEGDSLNESETNVTLTTTLIGNPYPSALDAVQFINDNKPGTGSGVISGTIQLWEQWSGSSHYLADYEGGYAFINAIATARAYQHAEIPIADQVSDEGIKMPTFSIPVGQGFFVEVIEDGDIEFNNGQRIYVKESDADGTSNNGSTFFRSSDTESSTTTEEANPFQIVRLEFATSEGSTRRFVLGFGEDATDGYDYGYDGGIVNDLPADDMGSILNGQQYVIQAFSPITDDKEIDLNLNASGNFTYSIQAVELTNLAEGQEIYLRDNLTNTYFDLTSEEVYNFTSEAGLFADRFDIVFQPAETLSSEEFKTDNTLIYVNQLEDKLYVKALTNQAKQLSITNMLGQVVKAYNSVTNQTLENGIDISNLNSGVYVVSVQTENNESIDKKVIIN